MELKIRLGTSGLGPWVFRKKFWELGMRTTRRIDLADGPHRRPGAFTLAGVVFFIQMTIAETEMREVQHRRGVFGGSNAAALGPSSALGPSGGRSARAVILGG